MRWQYQIWMKQSMHSTFAWNKKTTSCLKKVLRLADRCHFELIVHLSPSFWFHHLLIVIVLELIVQSSTRCWSLSEKTSRTLLEHFVTRTFQKTFTFPHEKIFIVQVWSFCSRRHNFHFLFTGVPNQSHTFDFLQFEYIVMFLTLLWKFESFPQTRSLGGGTIFWEKSGHVVFWMIP